ncbi:MAG TPA: DUF5915 domain-containing protein, partial [Acidimicrobiales bacterium]|nr:DUF5915 domain-containing protein [Acidimicrobiales bacterium]
EKGGVAAPLLPLLTENVFQGLTGERSVHLTDWPGPTDLPADAELVETMDLVRDVCSAAHAIRKANGRRARLPLRTLTVATADPERLRPFVALIADEVNVKEVTFSEGLEDVAERVLTLVPSALGPRLGSDAPQVFAAMKKGDWTVSESGVTAGGITLEPGEYELVLRPRNAGEGRTLAGDVGVVTLDITVDAELEAEGSARDVVRLVQAERRETGLHISDCITLELDAPAGTVAAVERHRGYVAEQTLAVAIRLAVADAVAIRITKAPCAGGI